MDSEPTSPITPITENLVRTNNDMSAPNFWGTYVGNNRCLIKPQYGGKLYSASDDLSITLPLMLEGAIEIGLTNWIIQNVQEGWHCIDVGANIGYFTVLLGYKCGKSGGVIAFEPFPKNFELLSINVHVNDLYETVDIRRQAVGEKKSRAILHTSEIYQGNGSLKEHSFQYHRQFGIDKHHEIDVDMVSLDCAPLWNQYDKIDLLKIDVEGAEPLVFMGMKDLLASKKIRRIAFEINRNMLGYQFDMFSKHLTELQSKYGAKFYRLNQHGITYAVTLDSILSVDYLDNVLAVFSD